MKKLRNILCVCSLYCIYSLHSQEMFLNFSMWDSYIYKRFIHMKCFLTFQYEITIYTVFIHIKYFLTFSREITIYIYSLHSYGLFLDFSLWNTHTHTTYT